MNITKLQDNDSDWYWIPNDRVSEFIIKSSKIAGLDYMDNPDAFDSFNEEYDKYATGGDSNLTPDIFVEDLENELDSNMNLISDFIAHYESETGTEIPEDVFLSFFNA